MNQFFYESRGREKVRELLDEGITSQAYHRSGASKMGRLPRVPKLILILLGFLGGLQLIAR